MNRNRKWIVCVAAGLFFIAGCGERPADGPMPDNDRQPVTGEELRRDLGKAADTATEYTKQKAAEVQRAMEKRLAEANDEIAELEKKLDDLSGQAKVRAEKELEHLRERRGEMRKKLDELSEASGKAWQDLKAGAESAWSDFKSAVDKASKQFDNEQQ